MEKKKILVVIDCQNDFITGSLRNEDAIKAVPNIVKKIDEFNGDYILVTMDTHSEDYLETNEGKKLPVVHCVQYTEGWQINKDIQDAISRAEGRNDGNKVIYFEKPTFGSVALAEFFEMDNKFTEEMDKDAELEIEFVGFCSDICVVSNALMVKAVTYNKANITVFKNCCAGVTPESHNAALQTMQMCQINVV